MRVPVKLSPRFLTLITVGILSGELNVSLFAQTRKLPSVAVKSLDGKMSSSSKFFNNGKPILLCFWATWCGPCKKELSALAEVYDDWKKETGVKIIAVAVDDSRSSSKVAPTVSGNGWDFEVYLDENSDFKRLLNVNMPPHVFLINANREIVWEHVGFKDGDEEHYLAAIKRLKDGKNVGK